MGHPLGGALLQVEQGEYTSVSSASMVIVAPALAPAPVSRHQQPASCDYCTSQSAPALYNPLSELKTKLCSPLLLFKMSMLFKQIV